MTDKERDMFEIKKETKQGDPQSSLLFNAKKEWAFASEITNTIASRICALLAAFFCLLLQRSSCKKKLCDFKHSTEEVGLKIHPVKTKILSSRSSNSRKEIEIDNIKVEILTKEESTKHLGQMVTFQQQEDDRDQESYQGSLGDVVQIETRADLEIVPSSTSALLIRHGGHANYELRLRNMDTLKRTRKE